MTGTEAVRDVMTAAVQMASIVCRAVQDDIREGEALTKADESPVTVADLASQAVVAHVLGKHFPDVPLTAEEDVATLSGKPRAGLRRAVVERARVVWPDANEEAVLAALGRGTYRGGKKGRFFTLDPIDGTKGFLRGEQYAVALALIDAGRVVAGVLGCPNLPGPRSVRGVLVHATRGGGTYIESLDASEIPPARIRVSQQADPRNLRLCESVESGHSDHGASVALRTKLGIVASSVRLDSQAKYALLAMGGAELYLRAPTRPSAPGKPERREWIWDHAAGVIVVEEAGGCVTDLAGRPFDFGRGRRLTANRGVVATNGLLHEAVLAALA
ncbi:MAG: 3'(2'),5'-bisphosphate nucleotidase [Planctomycetes bacterium]|nr:3'(2'),5'-bisphosphate nucleotidase [Planctomycetota bacterium]